jgi:hypothetical protein
MEMVWYENLKEKMKRGKSMPKAYFLAVQTERGRYRSLCGNYAFRVGRPGWKDNGFHLYTTLEAAKEAWNTRITLHNERRDVVIVRVAANYTELENSRATAPTIIPLHTIRVPRNTA